jgi:NAD(P)-dependent dehydrogenase (short-subunit alcohol dehydrogenase family)
MTEFPRFDLTGQVALVTGAARGLGRAISLALAHAGSDVALGMRDANTAGDLVHEIQTLGRQALPLQMDVTCLDQISRAVQDTASHFGRLDLLVNNAGVAPENPAENCTEEDFDLTLAVNLKGTFFASQAAGRLMIRQKGGRIINLRSQAGFAALPGEPVSADQSRISHLTNARYRVGKHNINVNAVAPHSFHARHRRRSRQPSFRADVSAHATFTVSVCLDVAVPSSLASTAASSSPATLSTQAAGLSLTPSRVRHHACTFFHGERHGGLSLCFGGTATLNCALGASTFSTARPQGVLYGGILIFQEDVRET